MNWRGPISVTFLICVIAFVVRVFGGQFGPKAMATVDLPDRGYSVSIQKPVMGLGNDVVLKTPSKTITRSFGIGDSRHETNVEALWVPNFHVLLLFDHGWEDETGMDSIKAVDPQNGKIELVMTNSKGRAFAGEIPESGSYSSSLAGDKFEIDGKPGHEVTHWMNAEKELLGTFTSADGPLRFEKNAK